MHDIISKFTTHLKTALTRALCVVVEADCTEIEPRHLLWALGTQSGCLAREILKEAGVKQEHLRALASQTEPGEKITVDQARQAIPVLSDASRKLIEKAVLTANMYEHRYIGTEHLLAGMLDTRPAAMTTLFEQAKVNAEELMQNLVTVLRATRAFPELPSKIAHLPAMSYADWDTLLIDEEEADAPDESKTPALDYFTQELTRKEVLSSTSQVVERDAEIDRLMHVLSRRTKNNPVLVGEPGVGKTAIVEGLAQRITGGDVPHVLANKKIHRLDLASLVAGTMYRGEFESRLRGLVDEVKERPEIIIFIDEIHTIVGAGSASGSLDAANILKPALARGEIRCIGATTPAEFKRHLETDGALERRFQTVSVREPDKATTRKMLKGALPFYETYHSVRFTEDAIEAALELSDQYLTGQQFPDKAIDLLDEAGAMVNVERRRKRTNTPEQNLRESLEETQEAKRRAVLEASFEKAQVLQKKEANIHAELKAQQSRAPRRTILTASALDIKRVVSEIANIPLEELHISDTEKLQTLASRLGADVLGQEALILQVAKIIRHAKLGLRTDSRPLASFMLIGPSGVGKTSLAKSLSRHLFDETRGLLRLDMSEYAESFSISKLIGAPAGYVGYREPSRLTDAVKQNPHCVVLFDECEKAHRDVQHLLLQILDEGELTDSSGRAVSFKHAVVILTTNVGSERFERGQMGFDDGGKSAQITLEDLRPELEDHFSRELLNRLDHLGVFEALSENTLKAIARKELNALQDQLRERAGDLIFEDAVLAHLISGANTKLGARGLQRSIKKSIAHPLTELLIDASLKSPRIKLFVDQNGLQIKHE